MKHPRSNRDAQLPVNARPTASNQPGFVHSVLGFTRLEIPEVELFETAVTFTDLETDPLTAHDALADVFEQKAGYGRFLFHKDSAVQGRYWVQSVEPWNRWPEKTANALEPKRIVIQLAEGLMYRFTLPVCAGRETVEGKEKRVVAFETTAEVERWFQANAANFGVKLMLANVSLQVLRFAHDGQHFKIPYAIIEGAFEVSNANRLRRRILKGFGSYRKVGLGQLQLSA